MYWSKSFYADQKKMVKIIGQNNVGFKNIFSRVNPGGGGLMPPPPRK